MGLSKSVRLWILKSSLSIDEALARAFRANSGRIVAALAHRFGDLQLAEDALQEALLQAKSQWLDSGLPDDPGAWLYTVSLRRLMDLIRKGDKLSCQITSKDTSISIWQGDESKEEQGVIPDERLSLIFVCCHPALDEKSRIALTLKILCGLQTREIARAFLVSETAMARRLTRAKTKIRANKIPFKIPESDQLGMRLDSVLSVVYLIFNESYTAFEGQSLTRQDLAQEAIRLAALLANSINDSQAVALHSLLLMLYSRFEARTAEQGQFIPLQLQDRSLWNRRFIDQGVSLFEKSVKQNSRSKYHLLAAINAAHCTSTSWQNTNWNEILALYRTLVALEDSPINRLNMYAAVAYSGQPALAKKGIETLKARLKSYQPYYVLLAYVDSELDNYDDALEALERAIELTHNAVELEFLLGKKGELSAKLIEQNDCAG